MLRLSAIFSKRKEKKAKTTHLLILCLAVFFLLTSSIYALTIMRDSDSNPLDDLFLFGNSKESSFGFQITDPTGLSSDPETALSNQFKYANQNKLFNIVPGDKLNFSYEISNTGTEALDIRETYYILTFIPQSSPNLDFAMFGSVALASSANAYVGTSALTPNKLDSEGQLYSFTSEPYTLSGSNEIIPGAPSQKSRERYMVFNYFAKNKTQGETIYIITTLEYKKHASDEWESSITETVISGGLTRSTEYRTDTNVYFSCDIVALENINPDNPGFVTFSVTDQTGAQTTLTFDDFNSPAIGIQRAYVPFHIPDMTGELTVSISSSSNVVCDTKEIIATVVSSNENTPPDPTMDMNIPVLGSLPTFAKSDHHEWVTYSARKNAAGEWEYEKLTHTASLETNFKLSPDSNIKTAAGNTIGSGYGVTAEIESEIHSDSVFYDVQNVHCFFPEFMYKDYSRKLEIISQDTFNTTWGFQTNPYSHSNSRVHYIPPAYPDGLYTVFATVRDAWTPVGELKGSVIAEVNILGSVYDDWYVSQTD